MKFRAWLMKSLEPLRWKIVALLDRFPDTCWMNLVMWALFPCTRAFEDCLHQTCNDDFLYCGKCWQTGRVPVEWGAEIFGSQKYWRIGLNRLLGREARP